LDRRPQAPGDQGARTSRQKVSEYGIRLREKQKVRMNYGLSERQLRRLFKEARSSRQPTGAKLIELLERRLDCAVWRAGFAPSIPSARQLVTHGHICVNGRKANTASIRLREGDVVQVRDKSKELDIVKDCCLPDLPLRPHWLQVEVDERKATLTGAPDSVPFPFEAHLVVEHYSRIAK
jgi:small subunit ribosomal protein S4